MKKLERKVAIVTGASKGIGAAIAKAYGAEGASVVVNYSSDKAGATKVVNDITSKGGKAVAVQANVSIAADVHRLFKETIAAYGKIDILMNNAGIYNFLPLEAITEEDFHRQFNTNVLGTILTAQEAVKHFGPEGGSIINISTIASTNPVPTSLVYSASKGAVDTITKTLAKELGSKKIRVNTIAPGFTLTEGTESAGIAGSEFEKHMVANTPLGRAGMPDDIARAAVFLASEDSNWITGERLTAAGGLL
jgi:3-oxoacyl-[acyl-carrier protein] reductase